MGFYAVNSHRIVDCPSCRLQPPEFTSAMEAFRAWRAGTMSPFTTRPPTRGCCGGCTCARPSPPGRSWPAWWQTAAASPFGTELVPGLRAAVPGLTSVVLNVNRDKTNVALGKECRTLGGVDAIQDRLCGLTFRLSPLSFYQVNHDQAERLYEKAAEYAALTGDECCWTCTAAPAPSASPWPIGPKSSWGWRSSPRPWRTQRRTPPATTSTTPGSSAGTRPRPPPSWSAAGSGPMWWL